MENSITTRAELDHLPKGSVIRCEIEEYMGVHTLTNVADCCGGWHDFEMIDGELEVVDDYTPQLPAELVTVDQYDRKRGSSAVQEHFRGAGDRVSAPGAREADRDVSAEGDQSR